MTGDTCDAITGDGSECDNPATRENGRCWIPSHSDPDAENPAGRPFTLGEDDHEDILQAARDGHSKAGCARAAGTGSMQLERYLDSHPEFREAFMRARKKGENTLIKRGLFDEDTDSSMAKFLLSTSFDYVKTEKRELEHSGEVQGIVINTEAPDNE